MTNKQKDYEERTIYLKLPADAPQEVIDEVDAFFKEEYRREYNAHRRIKRHEISAEDVFAYEPAAPYGYCSREYHMTPEEIVIMNDEDERTMQRMAKNLTETQYRRLTMLMNGFTVQEIARMEGKDHTSVAESIEAAAKKIMKYRKTPPKTGI